MKDLTGSRSADDVTGQVAAFIDDAASGRNLVGDNGGWLSGERSSSGRCPPDIAGTAAYQRGVEKARWSEPGIDQTASLRQQEGLLRIYGYRLTDGIVLWAPSVYFAPPGRARPRAERRGMAGGRAAIRSQNSTAVIGEYSRQRKRYLHVEEFDGRGNGAIRHGRDTRHWWSAPDGACRGVTLTGLDDPGDVDLTREQSRTHGVYLRSRPARVETSLYAISGGTGGLAQAT